VTFMIWVPSSYILRVIRRHIAHPFFNTIIASFSLIIIRDRNIFSNYLVSIEAFFDTFSASKFILTNAVNKFLAVFSVSVKFLA
jgi:hypothetical protein